MNKVAQNTTTSNNAATTVATIAALVQRIGYQCELIEWALGALKFENGCSKEAWGRPLHRIRNDNAGDVVIMVRNNEPTMLEQVDGELVIIKKEAEVFAWACAGLLRYDGPSPQAITACLVTICSLCDEIARAVGMTPGDGRWCLGYQPNMPPLTADAAETSAPEVH